MSSTNQPRPSHYVVAYALAVVVGALLSTASVGALGSVSRLPPLELVVLTLYAVAAATTVLVVLAAGSTPERTARTWLKERATIFQVIPIATAVAILLYVILRQCYASYYQPLGLAPEEVGLDYSAVLQTSVATVLSLLVTAVGGACLVALGAGLAANSVWHGLHPNGILRTIGVALGRLYEAALAGRKKSVLSANSPLARREASRLMKVAWTVVHILLVDYGRFNHLLAEAGRLVLLPAEFRNPTDVSASSFLRALARAIRDCALILIVASLPFAFAFVQSMSIYAAGFASDVMQGREVRPLNIGGFDVLPIRSEPARISWVASSPPTGLPSHVTRCMYVGSSGSTLVLFDVDDQSIIRVPATAVVIETGAGIKGNCI